MGDVIYLEDDTDDCSDEPKPKAATMTISGSDAIALSEFVRHVDMRCYDERFKDRGMMKSSALRNHLDRVRQILDTLLDYPEFEPFYYWSPPSEMPADQVEPELISAVADRLEVAFHCVGIYLAPDSIHVGSLELAIDDETGEACGIVSVQGMTSAATWTKAGRSLDETIGTFVNAISINEEGGAEPSA
ncbi:hypothetical protein [Rhizobium hainanense]|uniref:Uncharacterized protein n=1 Tax=Rhizobium hainanense TaxID=52131 RepID=A0A1C3WGE8_9HYPH|nr:hypothetical protein [Rhizobium hainanense]SCB38946.1 hypothetical protein GA0061100_11827 [Rhizobium hainanense]